MMLSLVVLFFALGQTDFQFGAALAPVHRQRYESVATPFHRADQPVNFRTIE